MKLFRKKPDVKQIERDLEELSIEDRIGQLLEDIIKDKAWYYEPLGTQPEGTYYAGYFKGRYDEAKAIYYKLGPIYLDLQKKRK